MDEPKFIRVKITPEIREMISKLKKYAVLKTDTEAVVFAIQCTYFEKVGQYE